MSTPSKARSGGPGVVVLAAGEGTRFRSAKPKVLHEMCGLPVLGHVLAAASALRPAQLVVVAGKGADAVGAFVGEWSKGKASVALQAELLGTADAARVGEEALGRGAGEVVVLLGDMPLVSGVTLKSLLAHHRRRGAAATVLTARVQHPRGYGRVLRDTSNTVRRIVEDADASAAEKQVDEISAGVWVFDRAMLRSSIAAVGRDNAKGELYLSDVAEILSSKGEVVEAFCTPDASEIAGVNSRAQLASASAVMRARIANAHMDAGVTIVDPAQTYIDAGVRIGADTTILPLTFITGTSVVGSGCEIGPGVRAKDSRIGDGARVQFSVLDGATVGPHVTVGPYAYLRPGARLAEGAKAGTFVEIKKSAVGKRSKVPHLAYIGDTRIGEDVNVGAGTITCNYDGVSKHETVIGDGAFIGSDTMLVAPVRIGAGATTAAGSAIAKDVPPGALGIERTQQQNIAGFAEKRKKKAAAKNERGAPK